MKLLMSVVLVAISASFCVAEEAKQAEATNETPLVGIEWLKQFEGTWATDHDGTMRARVIGQKWIVSEYSFPGGFSAVQTLGYDTKTEKFVGTWVDGSSSHIWRYVGSLDETGKVLVLETEGPDLNNANKMAQYRDIYEFKSENEISAISKMLDDKKQWSTFSDGVMTRK